MAPALCGRRARAKTRTDGRAMGGSERVASGPVGSRPAETRLETNPQRHILAPAHGRTLARPAAALRSLAERIPLVQPMAPGRHLGSDARSPAHPPGPPGPDRLGPVVHRRHDDSGKPGSGWSGEKGGAKEPPDHALGRSRGGFSTKLHLVTDGGGLPLAVEVTAGQRHESTQFETLMDAVRIPQPRGRFRSRPRRVAGDKGYSYPWIRAWLRRHAIGAVIPQRSDQAARHRGRPLAFDREAYRRRSIIECCIGWLKECRRLATRFEKLAVNFLAMVKVSIIQRILRILFSDRA